MGVLMNNKSCPKCHKTYMRQQSFKAHVRSCHENINDFSCHQCDYKTNNKNYFKVHYQVHTSTKYPCRVCKKEFNTEMCVTEHVGRVHVERNIENLSCDQCEKTFKTKTGLKGHSFTHRQDQENALKCTECNYKTWIKAELKIHIYTHFPEKRDNKHKCDLCDYKTWTRKKLVRHSLVHTVSRWYP